jgi:hypothetical protein
MALLTDVRLFEERQDGGVRDYFDVISLIQRRPVTLAQMIQPTADPANALVASLSAFGIVDMRAHELDGRGRVLLLIVQATGGTALPNGVAAGADVRFSYFDDYGIEATTGDQTHRAGTVAPDPALLVGGDSLFAREQRRIVAGDTKPFAWPEAVVKPSDGVPPADQPYLGIDPPPGTVAPATYLVQAHLLRGLTRVVLFKNIPPVIP